MASEQQMTYEEEAYEQISNEAWETLSEPGRFVLKQAAVEAYKLHLCRRYSYQPWEYEEAMEQMRLVGANLTDRDSDVLAKLWRAALAAAASIDPDDRTPAWYKVNKGYLHGYYRTESGMVENILQEKREAEFQGEVAEQRQKEEIAKRQPEDLSCPPF